MILPRAVLKWLQRLDLTYSIRDPERDLSNGFIVAEILCRHFPNDISLHSFDTGSSRSVREGNWSLIFRFCSKHAIDIGDLRVQKNILRQHEETLLRLVLKLYAYFEDKPEPVLFRPLSSSSTPSYACPTASLRVKEASEMSEDILEQRYRRYLIIKKHEEKVHASRQTS